MLTSSRSLALSRASGFSRSPDASRAAIGEWSLGGLGTRLSLGAKVILDPFFFRVLEGGWWAALLLFPPALKDERPGLRPGVATLLR
jgi:hypothetical protein